MSKKNVSKSPIVIIIGFFLIAIGIFYFYISSGTVKRDFQDWELLISENDLPAGWKLIEEYKSINDNEGQKSGAQYIWGLEAGNEYSRTSERIYHFSNEYWSYRKFLQWVETYIPSNKDEEVFILTGYDFSQLHANTWDFGCEDVSPSEFWINCVYVAQYDEFMLDFSVFGQINDQLFISSDQLFAIIIRIDDKISSYLDD